MAVGEELTHACARIILSISYVTAYDVAVGEELILSIKPRARCARCVALCNAVAFGGAHPKV